MAPDCAVCCCVARGFGRSCTTHDASTAVPILVRRSWLELVAKSPGPSYWPVRFEWSDSAQARRSDGGLLRTEALERFSNRIWRGVRRRGGSPNPERESSAGPGTGGAKRVAGAETALPLPVNRRDNNPAWPASVSPDERNFVSLDRVAGLYGRGVIDPRSCTRSAWPYGPPRDGSDPSAFVRLLTATVDSFLTSADGRPREWVESVTPRLVRCSGHDCRGRCQSISSAARRPVEIEETYRAEHGEVEDLNALLDQIGLLPVLKTGGIPAVCELVGLTDRQTDVVLMSAGLQMSGRRIAKALGISQATARGHLNAALRRCQSFVETQTLSLLQVG